MIKDYNESVPFQPVCIDHRPRHHGVNGTPLNRLNFNTPALDIGVEGRVFLTAEEGDDAPIGRPRQCTLHPSGGDHPGRRPGRSRATALLQLAQQTVDARRGPFQFLEGMFVRLFFMSDLGEIDLLFFLDRLQLSHLFLIPLLVRQHPNSRVFPLPLRLLYTGHIGPEHTHEGIIPFGYGGEILKPALEITIRVRSQQGFPMPKTALHVLTSQPGQNGVLAFSYTHTQVGELRIDGLDLLIFLSQLSANVLMRLSIAQHPFVECLNSLQEGLSLFPRFIGLFAFFFDLTFELVERLAFFLNLVDDRIGNRPRRQGKTHQPPDHDSDHHPRPTPNALASPKRRIDTKLPATPSPIPTATRARQTDGGKNAMRLSSPANRPVVRICSRT